MNLISMVSIGLSSTFLIAGTVLFILNRHNSSQQVPGKDENKGAIDDRGDRILWEIGEGLPLVDPQTGSQKLTRRGFIPRFALGIFAAAAGGPLSRVWAETRKTAVANAQDPVPDKGLGAGTLIASNEQQNTIFAARQDHNDTHNDFETHGDNMTPHQDYTNPRNGAHFDVPHYDLDTGHFDTHNDF